MKPQKNLNDLLIDRFVAEEFAQQHLRRPHARFLDLGCGDQRYKKYTEKEGWECFFADFEARAEGVSVLLDAHSLPFKDESFDLVLLTEVLEHLADPMACLNEIRRVLRGDGEVVLTVPFLWGMHETPFDFFRYTEFGLDRMVHDAGLELRCIQRRGDFIGVCLSLAAHFYANVVEFLRRRTILSPLGWALGGLGAMLGPPLFASYMALCGKRILRRYDGPGRALKNVGGQMNAWPLGFHLVARKPPS